MISNFLSKSVILLILHLCLSNGDENKDTCEIFFDKMKLIKGGDKLLAGFMIKKTGSTEFLVNGDLENYVQLDEDWTMVIRVLKSDSADGEYRFLVNYPMRPKGLCTVLKNEYKKYFYESLKDYSNAPHYDTCPLLPKKYTIKDYPFDANVFKKYLSPGYFQLNVLFSHLEESDIIQYDILIHVE